MTAPMCSGIGMQGVVNFIVSPLTKQNEFIIFPVHHLNRRESLINELSPLLRGSNRQMCITTVRQQCMGVSQADYEKRAHLGQIPNVVEHQSQSVGFNVLQHVNATNHVGLPFPIWESYRVVIKDRQVWFQRR